MRPGARRPEDLLRAHATDGLSALQEPELGAGDDAERGGGVRIELPGPHVLVDHVPERVPDPVGDRDRRDLVAVALQQIAGRELDQIELVPDPAGGPQGEREQLAQAGRPVDRQRPLARAQVKGLQQPREAKPVVGVEVGQEHLGQLGQPDRLHELALRALAAVEQDAVAAAANEHRRQPTPRGRDRAGGAGEENREVHRRPVCQPMTMSSNVSRPPATVALPIVCAGARRRSVGLPGLKI